MFAFDVSALKVKHLRFMTLAICGFVMFPGGIAQAEAPETNYVKGQVLVQMKPGIAANSAEERLALSAVGARVVSRIPEIGVSIVKLPLNGDEPAHAAMLRARPEVQFAELDEQFGPATLPNDPYFATAWHLTKINAAGAWDNTTGSSGTIVAVLDSGLDATHPDFAGKLVPGWNWYNNNSNTTDVHGHGTAVAGVVGAATNNGAGIASVSWNCKIMPIRVADTSCFASASAIANGLVWAANNGARVANVSFLVSGNATVATAAQYFQNTAQGVVTVSAGNSSNYLTLPDNPYMLTVSATASDDTLCTFTNTGTHIDLAAPGQNLKTTGKGGIYGLVSGTSFSAPVVAGVAALVISGQSSLTGAQVQDILKQSADDRGPSGWDPGYGWGRVNAAGAVALAMNTQLPPPEPPPAPPPPGPPPPPVPPPPPAEDTTPPTITITSPSNGAAAGANVNIKTSASDNVGVTKVEFYIDGTLKSTDASAPFTYKWQSNQAAPGQHVILAKAFDAAGNFTTAQITVTK